VRGERQREDRRVRRIDLAVDGRDREVLRQEAGGGVDRRLHLLLGDVEAQVEGEAQRDERATGRAGRRHLAQPRHLPQLALERRRHRRRHDVRVGAGVEGGHLDGRVVDLRQRRHRQLPVSERAGEQDGHHEQAGGHRPDDERPGQAHEWPCSAAARAGVFGATGMPSRSESAPSTTTTSPGERPSSIDVSPPSLAPTCTGRACAVLPGVTTYTNGPCVPRRTATPGTRVAPRRTSSRSRALTNWFGKSASSSFGNCAFTFTVPVVGSIALSTVSTEPVARRRVPSRSKAWTSGGSPPWSRARRLGRSSSGTEKTTEIGWIWVIVTSPPVSFACTMFPASTRRSPSRPLMGAMMREYVSCSLAASTCPRSVSMAAASWRTSASCVSSCCLGIESCAHSFL